MQFGVFGPFRIKRNGNLVDRSKIAKQDFWDEVEYRREGLSQACGCYVFVIRGRAWYVGLTKRQGFKQECFADHKITRYNEALQAVKSPPSLILIAKQTPAKRFTKPSGNGHADIQLLENS